MARKNKSKAAKAAGVNPANPASPSTASAVAALGCAAGVPVPSMAAKAATRKPSPLTITQVAQSIASLEKLVQRTTSQLLTKVTAIALARAPSPRNGDPDDEMKALRKRVAELEAENGKLVASKQQHQAEAKRARALAAESKKAATQLQQARSQSSRVAAAAAARLIGASTGYAKGHGYKYEAVNPAVTELVDGGLHPPKSITAFHNGLRKCGYASLEDLLQHPDGYTLALHGTPDANIGSILEAGFDPSKRSRQSYGAGEYFDCGDGAIAEAYAASGVVIMAIVIQRAKNVPSDGSWIKFASYDSPASWQPICVVNNPEDDSSYVLPISVVSKAAPIPARLVQVSSATIGRR